jgi:ABC-2 type transport system ATP-binding protein
MGADKKGDATSSFVTVNGVSKTFGGGFALRDVGFTVQAGEVLGLIGPNGAGKTTLFECVAGTMAADAGTFRVRGQAIAPLQRKDVLFYLPDRIVPWAEQSVSWVLGLFENLYSSAVKASDLIKVFQLSPLSRSRLGSLSKGELKRTLLAVGLLTPQPLLLLDEPFDGLDLRQTREVMTVLREHAARGRTLMLSIHQLVDAARVCDRLVLLSAGRIVGEGTVDELRSRAGMPEAGLEEIFLALT